MGQRQAEIGRVVLGSLPDATLDETAAQLLNHLTGASLRALRRQDSLAIATSGGLDSSIIAAILAPIADFPIQLVNVSAPGAVDAPRARTLAVHLGLPLAQLVLNEHRVQQLLPQLVPLIGESAVDPKLASEWGVPSGTRFVNPVVTAWEIPVFAAAQEAARFAPRLVLGQGADEYFGGYQRYVGLPADEFLSAMEADRGILETRVVPVEERIATHVGQKFFYPYLNDRVKAFARRLPPDQLIHGSDRKRVLRRVAELLDLPSAIVNVPKTAAQYGSGAADILKTLAAQAGVHQNEYLGRFVPHRRMGSIVAIE